MLLEVSCSIFLPSSHLALREFFLCNFCILQRRLALKLWRLINCQFVLVKIIQNLYQLIAKKIARIASVDSPRFAKLATNMYAENRSDRIERSLLKSFSIFMQSLPYITQYASQKINEHICFVSSWMCLYTSRLRLELFYSFLTVARYKAKPTIGCMPLCRKQ